MVLLLYLKWSGNRAAVCSVVLSQINIQIHKDIIHLCTSCPLSSRWHLVVYFWFSLIVYWTDVPRSFVLLSLRASFCTQERRFHLSVERNLCLLWFCITTLSDWLKNSCHFLSQSEVKPKPIVSRSCEFSRTLCTCFEFWLDNGLLCVLCDWPE